MGSSSPSPDSTTALSQVSWQTAFWTLVPLAINVMAQPAGRVCNFESRSRTYLRCSPVLCAADSFSIIVRLGVYGSGFLLRQTISFRDRLGLVLYCRFHGVKEDGAGEGIRGLGRMTRLRWLFFVFGTLNSAIKLMSFQEMPWTKAWGVMFLFSFVIVEVLVILSWIIGDQDALIHDLEDVTEVKSVEENLAVMDASLLFFAFISHIFILVWIVADLWPHNENGGDSNPLQNISLFAMKVVRTTVICLWPYIAWFINSLYKDTRV